MEFHYLHCSKKAKQKLITNKLVNLIWPFDVFSARNEEGLQGMQGSYGNYVHVVEMYSVRLLARTENVIWYRGRPKSIDAVLKNPSYQEVIDRAKELKIKLERNF